MQVISLSDCLAIMETGQPFSIMYVTADKKRKTAGDVKSHDGCTLSKRPTAAAAAVTAVKESNAGGRPEIVRKEKYKDARSPHHYIHSTRNIVLKNGDIRKVHIRLIIGFNGKRVVY